MTRLILGWVIAREYLSWGMNGPYARRVGNRATCLQAVAEGALESLWQEGIESEECEDFDRYTGNCMRPNWPSFRATRVCFSTWIRSICYLMRKEDYARTMWGTSNKRQIQLKVIHTHAVCVHL